MTVCHVLSTGLGQGEQEGLDRLVGESSSESSNPAWILLIRPVYSVDLTSIGVREKLGVPNRMHHYPICLEASILGCAGKNGTEDTTSGGI
jgi:hypothetical protein